MSELSLNIQNKVYGNSVFQPFKGISAQEKNANKL